MLERIQQFSQSTKGRTLLAVLLTIYVVSIVLSQIADIPFIQRFQHITNTRQIWVLFHTVPEKITFKMVAISDSGERFQIVPGQKGGKQGFRYQYHLFNTLRDENKLLLEDLSKKVATKFDPHKSRSFHIILERDMMRDFHYSKKDGKLYIEDTKSFGPYPIP